MIAQPQQQQPNAAIVLVGLFFLTCITTSTDSFVMKPILTTSSMQLQQRHQPTIMCENSNDDGDDTTTTTTTTLKVNATTGSKKDSCNHNNNNNNKTTKRSKAIYSFTDARRMARNYQFSTREEFLDYACPGAYQLPKNPDEVWEHEWKGWEDWLGIRFNFDMARQIARTLKVSNQEAYMELIASHTLDDNDDASRLPYQPDKVYTNDWISWQDWLGTDTDALECSE